MLKFRLEQKKQLIQWHNAILLESWRQRKLVVSWTLKSDTFKSVLNKIHEYIGKQHGNQHDVQQRRRQEAGKRHKGEKRRDGRSDPDPGSLPHGQMGSRHAGKGI